MFEEGATAQVRSFIMDKFLFAFEHEGKEIQTDSWHTVPNFGCYINYKQRHITLEGRPLMKMINHDYRNQFRRHSHIIIRVIDYCIEMEFYYNEQTEQVHKEKREFIKADPNTKEKYHNDLLDDKWKTVRKMTILRDDNKCTICGKTSPLFVHHLYYYKVYTPPWEYPLGALITLCDDCHKEVHQSPNIYISKPNIRIS